MASDKLYPAFARLLLIPAALIAAAAAATAEPQCLCRYDGKRFEQGQCTCIVISGNARYACCDRVLNNSSWTFVSDQCEAETSMGDRATKIAADLPALRADEIRHEGNGWSPQ